MIGKTVSHYKILGKLGSGGMGVVYKAEDTKLERVVALKFLPSNAIAGEEEKNRFEREAKAAAALNHPNIATIHAIEEHDDELFIVMEFIEGRELKSIVNNGQLESDDIARYAIQISEGLHAAHENGIIHRDIKSSNIMITDKGQVKIMDFGLAKLRGGSQLTQTGTTMGTVAYMSPEQATGSQVDHRSDIWSFGVVLYEMVTGQLPFKGEYDQAVVYSILHEEPEPVSALSTSSDANLERIVQKALVKDPEKRYQSADEVIRELGGTTGPHRDRLGTASKRPKLAWLISVAMVMLIAVSIYFLGFVSKEGIRTIAVLPFVDLSPEQDNEYFADGLAEELLNMLSRDSRLRVTSRTSSFSFKGKNVDLRTIAEKLNVKHILEGSVRKSGTQIRITAQLVDVVSDANLWSGTYDRNFENIFTVQENISLSVASALQVTLLGKAKQTPKQETSPQAYNAFLQGEYFAKQGGKESWEKAITYYEQALAIDPAYARAWVGLGDVHQSLAASGAVPFEEGYRKARDFAQKALHLDPKLAGALSLLAWTKMAYDWDWDGADSLYQRARELDPGEPNILTGSANLASAHGRLEEAIELVRRQIELDPLHAPARWLVGRLTYYAGLLKEAEAAFHKSLELNYPLGAHAYLGRIYLEKGNPDSALAEMMRETDPGLRLFGQGLAYHAMEQNQQADSTLAAFIREYQNGYAFQIAEVYAYRGEADQAFEWLERAYEQRDSGLAEMKGDPLLRNIENDPRYAAFMKKMDLPL